jgi:hypothetical protein
MDLAASERATQEVPLELAGPPPRAVTLNFDGDDARFAVAVILLFFVGGGIALGWGSYRDVQQYKHRALLRSDGRDVVGEVTRISSGRGSVTAHYRFNVNGVTYFGTALEPDTRAPGASPNQLDKIPVRFLPSNPTINHPGAWEWSPYTELVPRLFLIFFFSMGTVLLVYLCRQRKLVRHGKPAAGIVTSCIRKNRTFWVEYEFQTENGSRLTGHGDSTDSYEAGAPIWILYLPQRPSRNGVYPLSLFDVAG